MRRDPVLVSQRLFDEPRCAPVGFAIERAKAPRESEVDVVVEWDEKLGSHPTTTPGPSPRPARYWSAHSVAWAWGKLPRLIMRCTLCHCCGGNGGRSRYQEYRVATR